MDRSNSVSILVIEDNPADLDYLKELLSEHATCAYKIRTAQTLKEGLQYIKENNIKIILLDLGLPDATEAETLEKVLRASPQTPVIILTGRDDEDLALQAVRQGAQDYLVKDEINSKILFKSIHFALKRQEKGLEEKEESENLDSLFKEETQQVKAHIEWLEGKLNKR